MHQISVLLLVANNLPIMSFPNYFASKLPKKSFKKLLKHFNASESEYIDSKVLDTNLKKNVIAPEIRNSLQKRFKDGESFRLIEEEVLSHINNENENENFSMKLVYSEIDLIKYEVGGFFKRHHDFVHFVSDTMKCYSLLICLEGDCVGGETKLYIEDEEYTIAHSKKPRHYLLFRNELDHEGVVIKSGKKVILKVDLWCFKDYQDAESLTIKFDNDDRFFIIPKEILQAFPDSILAKHKKFNKQTGSINDFIIKNFTYEDFLPVYKLLCGKYSLAIENKRILDFLGITNSMIEFAMSYQIKRQKEFDNKIAEFQDFVDGKKESLSLKIQKNISLTKSN